MLWDDGFRGKKEDGFSILYIVKLLFNCEDVKKYRKYVIYLFLLKKWFREVF